MKKVLYSVVSLLLLLSVSCKNTTESSDDLTSPKTAVLYLLSQNGTYFYDYSTFAEDKSAWNEPSSYSFKLKKTMSSIGNRSEVMAVTVSDGTSVSDYSNCFGYIDGCDYTYEPFYSINSISDLLNYIENYYRESIEETNKTSARKNTIKITWEEINGYKYPKTVIFTTENYESLINQIITSNPLFAGTGENSTVVYEIVDFSVE